MAMTKKNVLSKKICIHFLAMLRKNEICINYIYIEIFFNAY